MESKTYKCPGTCAEGDIDLIMRLLLSQLICCRNASYVTTCERAIEQVNMARWQHGTRAVLSHWKYP